MPYSATDRYALPPLPSKLIVRVALLQQLSAIYANKLCIVAAPAGFSKTTSLSLFAHRETETEFRWLSLQTLDQEADLFFSRFAKCIGSLFPAFEHQFQLIWEDLRRKHPPSNSKSPARFYEQFGGIVGEALIDKLSEETILVLDDYHLIDQEPFAKPFLHGLLANTPAFFRVMIASRTEPALDTMIFAARQQLLEISPEQLLFSETEIKELADAHFSNQKISISPERLSELHSQIGGWAAGAILALETLALQARSASFLRFEAESETPELSKENIHRYFAEQVFASLTVEEQHLARFISVFESFTIEQAAALIAAFRSNRPSAALLKTVKAFISELHRRKLLLKTFESETAYRFHHLLQAFLQTKLSSAEKTKLHLIAGDIMATAGIEKALFHYALSNDREKLFLFVGSKLLAAPIFPYKFAVKKIQAVSPDELSPPLLVYRSLLLVVLHHQLGNIEESEREYLRARQYPLPFDLPICHFAALCHFRNLQMQSRFTEVVEEIEAYCSIDSPLAVARASALAMRASSLSLISASRQTLKAALKELDELLKSAFLDKEIPVLRDWIWKDKCAVAQNISYQAATAAYRERERQLENASPKARAEFERDFAFTLVLGGDFIEAKPHIDACLRLAGEHGYGAAFYTAKYLLADYLTAKGEFDKAKKLFIEARSYFEFHSPKTFLAMLSGEILCDFLNNKPLNVAACAALFESVYEKLPAQSFQQTFQRNTVQSINALAHQHWDIAEEWLTQNLALSISHQQDVSIALTHLLQTYFYSVSPCTDLSFLEQLNRFHRNWNLTDVELRSNQIKYYWRFAQVVCEKVLSLLPKEDSRNESILEIYALVQAQEASLSLKRAKTEPQNRATLFSGLDVRALGGLRIAKADEPEISITEEHFSTKPLKAVFSILLIHLGKSVKDDHFFETLWTRSAYETKIQLLRNTVSQIRRLFYQRGLISDSEPFITKSDAGYKMTFGEWGKDYRYDVEELKRLIQSAEAAKASGQPEKRVALLKAAIALYEGDFFGNGRSDVWILDEQESLRASALDALEALAENAFQKKEFDEALSYCHKILEQSPLSEHAYSILIQTYFALQRAREAHRVFDQCKKSFRKLLQTYPPLHIERLIRPLHSVAVESLAKQEKR